MRSSSKMRIYDKLQKEFDLILKHKDTGQCLKTLNAYRRIPKHWSRIVKIENAEAKSRVFLKIIKKGVGILRSKKRKHENKVRRLGI